MVNEPAAGTIKHPFMVASLVFTMPRTIEFTVTSELVTVSEVAAAANRTVPVAVLIVCAPVVPLGVIVFPSVRVEKVGLAGNGEETKTELIVDSAYTIATERSMRMKITR